MYAELVQSICLADPQGDQAKPEFIADHQVLQAGLDRKQYQYLLLKVVGVPAFAMSNQFNFSSLKKRIAMMNKMRSAKVHLVKFLLYCRW
ncbi:hypothetical protein [Paraflavitalea speifideaquila]|uniref:hypothetical protein n=1 Tax=Paraflavitalea speifideaquila TaxID=3076558 RepID=UPI0028EB1D00|nr:hypothetical protein [Paraflavitalea speifideiaquila]